MSSKFIRTSKFINLRIFIRTSKFITLAIFTLIFIGCTSKNKSETVNLAIWANYISPEAQELFTKETGIKLNILNFSSNEELLAKIQAGNSGIDVAVPSGYMVNIMSKLQLLQTLDSHKLPLANLEPRYLNQIYDSKNEFSVPYAWTTTGIAFRKDVIKSKLSSWKDIFNSKELEGKISLLDDQREVLGAALKLDGHSINSTSSEEIAKAKQEILSHKKIVKQFSSDLVDSLTNKEVVVAQSYSSDALQANKKSNGQIEFVIPSEGGTIAIDSLVITKNSKNTENAYKLIQFLLRKDIHSNFVKNVMAGPVVKGVRSELPKELQNNPILFPDEKMAKNLEPIIDLGEKNSLYEEAWRDIKMAQ